MYRVRVYLGLLAHEPGGKEPFLFTFNETIKGDANSKH